MMPESLRQALCSALISWADDELLLGHRDSEWTGLGPIIEADIALSSMAQDEMGHALAWYELAHSLGAPDPDRLVFERGPEAYRNATLLELPRGDWAFCLLRHYLFDMAEWVRLEAWRQIPWEPWSDLAERITREEKYHLLHDRTWLERLAFGTEESRHRLQGALIDLWPHALGLWEAPEGEDLLVQAGWITGSDQLQARWEAEVRAYLGGLGLQIPDVPPRAGGRYGRHTEHLAPLLEAMQLVYRSIPGAKW
jgi:ring-1,2-phenylacetyl-CoA epoxidase subunit PaaC|nr:MAG: phenylacetate-CoA oxygenase subunit PaaI [Bacteroidota bacterium]